MVLRPLGVTEDNVLLPLAAVSDGNKASDAGNKALLSLSALLPPPSLQQLVDNHDTNMLLGAVTDTNKDPFGFFKMLPIAGPSCVKH